jgi:predicted Zn-dependent protease
MQVRKYPLLFCLLLGFVGCDMPFAAPGEGQGAGPGKRSQTLALTPDQELEVGRQAYKKALGEMRGRILSQDQPEVVRARRICMQIVRAAGIRPLQKEMNLRMKDYRFEWEVNVVRDEQVNAFCLPGGKIVVFTGIMNVVENDDELAAVLAHEIAHALAHHSSERVAQEQRGGGSGLGGLRNDRMQEKEADHIGLFLMTFAGFNPEAAVHFWERMERNSHGARLPEILSDHPSDARRVHDIREGTPRALAAKKAFDEGRILESAK